MLTLLLQNPCRMQQLLRRNAFRRKDIRNSRLSARDGSGLIERYNLHFSGLLQRDCRLEHNTVLSTHAVSDHDGYRSGKSERTRAADDQNRDRSRQRKADRLSGKQPHNQCHDRNSNDRRYKYAGDFVGNLGNRRLGRRGIADHLDDLG